MKEVRILGDNYFQLLGAIGVLVEAREELPSPKALDHLLKTMCRDCDHELCNTLHREFRARCLSKKLIKPGYLFSRDDMCRTDYYINQ